MNLIIESKTARGAFITRKYEYLKFYAHLEIYTALKNILNHLLKVLTSYNIMILNFLNYHSLVLTIIFSCHSILKLFLTQ